MVKKDQAPRPVVISDEEHMLQDGEEERLGRSICSHVA